jgi:hypothetical protein
MRQVHYVALTAAGIAIISLLCFIEPPAVSAVVQLPEKNSEETSVISPAGSYRRSLDTGEEQNLLLNLDGSFQLFTDGVLTDQGRWEWDQKSTLELFGGMSNYMGGIKCRYVYSEDSGSSIIMRGDKPNYLRD